MSAKHDIKTQTASALLLLSFIVTPIYKPLSVNIKSQKTKVHRHDIKHFFRYEKWPRQYIWR